MVSCLLMPVQLIRTTGSFQYVMRWLGVTLLSELKRRAVPAWTMKNASQPELLRTLIGCLSIKKKSKCSAKLNTILCVNLLFNPTLKRFDASRRFNAELMATEYIQFPREKIQHTLALNGPNSPLEVKMYGKVKSLAGCTMTVDDDSVNSVLLDSNPEGKHERFLIAAQVSLQPCRFTV